MTASGFVILLANKALGCEVEMPDCPESSPADADDVPEENVRRTYRCCGACECQRHAVRQQDKAMAFAIPLPCSVTFKKSAVGDVVTNYRIKSSRQANKVLSILPALT